MKYKSFVHIAVLIWSFLSAAASAQSAQVAMPSDGQVTVFGALRLLPCTVHGGNGCHDLRYTGQALEFDVTQEKRKGQAETTHYTIDMRTLPKVGHSCGWKHIGTRYICSLKLADNQTPSPGAAALFEQCLWTHGAAKASKPTASCYTQWTDYTEVANALNRLHKYSLQPEQPLVNFSKAAAEWRALATKPAMPEEARVHRLLAEDEIKKKHPAQALYHFEAALEIQPTWPEGWFNAALVSAELELFAQAAEYMQSYLELMPDAPDAQSARDQMVMWKYKAQNSSSPRNY